jgi:hypothetical protein
MKDGEVSEIAIQLKDPCGPLDGHQRQRRCTCAQWEAVTTRDGGPMQALKDLFTSDVGLMSLASIVSMLGMGVFLVRYFLKHMKEDAAKAAAASSSTR